MPASTQRQVSGLESFIKKQTKLRKNKQPAVQESSAVGLFYLRLSASEVKESDWKLNF